MALYIHGTDSLSSINEAFQAKYPNLRVEFYLLNNRGQLSHVIRPFAGNDQPICQIGGSAPDASFSFDPRQRVSELERHFRDTFKLGMVILRKHQSREIRPDYPQNENSASLGM